MPGCGISAAIGCFVGSRRSVEAAVERSTNGHLALVRSTILCVSEGKEVLHGFTI